jgi:transcriptional antiterminator RfaH
MESCRWTLVRTHPRREKTACIHIARQGGSPYCPRITAGEVMFPCYVFVYSCELNLRWLNSTVAVSSVVRMGREPAVVPVEFVGALKDREGEDGLIRLDEGPRFTPGQKVRVKSGAFRDFGGIYEGMLPGQRVQILLELMGRETLVSCGEAMIEAL